MKHRVYAIYTVSVFVGEFEAETPDEAESLAEDSPDFSFSIGLCHQCNKQVGDDPNFFRFETEPV